MTDGIPPINTRIERDIEAVRSALNDLQRGLDTKLDSIRTEFNRWAQDLPEKYVPRREIVERFNNMAEDTQRSADQLGKRITELEDTQRWLTRAVVGAIVTGLFGVFFTIVRAGLLAGAGAGG